MRTAFEIGGEIVLSVGDLDPRESRWLERQMDPCAAGAAGDRPAELVLERDESCARKPLVDLQRDAGDGRVTGCDGLDFFLIEAGRRCRIPDCAEEASPRCAYEPGFPLWRALGEVAKPALQLLLPRTGAVAVHSASVDVDGAGVVIAGWSESGKTETALALVEAGARLISDKWSVLRADRRVAPFPGAVGIRGWALAYLPRLRDSLTSAQRSRMLVAGGLSAACSPLLEQPRRAGPAAGMVAGAFDRALGLAGRVSVRPAQVNAAHGRAGASCPVPLERLVLLTTIPDGGRIEAKQVTGEWAARRLARTAAFERRGMLGLLERRGYALGIEAKRHDSEQDILVRLLADTPVLELRTPFPADPRRVAAQLEPWL